MRPVIVPDTVGDLLDGAAVNAFDRYNLPVDDAYDARPRLLPELARPR